MHKILVCLVKCQVRFLSAVKLLMSNLKRKVAFKSFLHLNIKHLYKILTVLISVLQIKLPCLKQSSSVRMNGSSKAVIVSLQAKVNSSGEDSDIDPGFLI